MSNHLTGEKPLDRYKLLFRLQILAGIGCAVIILYSLHFWGSGDVLRIIGVGILAGGAALVSGFVTGFIFGVPRTGADKSTPKPSSGAADSQLTSQLNAVTTNSNLVEISDWLTKILVGVGLVELNSIPVKLGILSAHLGFGLRPAQCGRADYCADLIHSGQAAGLAILVFYFALGFLWGYVWTRLYFQRDLGGLVEGLRRDKRVADLIMSAEASINEAQFDEALDFVNQALEESPLDGRAVLTKGRILRRQGLISQALIFADQAIALLPGKAEPIYNKACYQALLAMDKNEVFGNLRSAFRLNPALRATAREDADLKSVSQEADFKALVEAPATS